MNRTKFSTFSIVFLTSCFSLLTFASAQGPLTPPGGPAPMMRSLDQIEPRTPITSLPYTINESGSYIVTGPLASTNHGIIVQAHNVTVDLMGFTITGSSSTNFHGILAQGGEGVPLRNVHIRNGGVQNFGHGVRFANVDVASIRYLTVIQNAGYGLFLTGLPSPVSMSQYITVEYCTIMDNQDRGIVVSTTSGFAYGYIIRYNTLRGNGDIGMFLRNLFDSVVTDNLVGPQDGAGTTHGIFGSGFSQSLLARNIVTGNTNNFAFGPGSPVRGGSVTKTDGTLDNTGVEAHPWANFNW